MGKHYVPLTPVERAIQWGTRVAERARAGYQRVRNGRGGWAFSWLGWMGRTVARLVMWYKRRVWDRFARGEGGRVTALRGSMTAALTVIALWMIPAAIATVWNTALMATTWNEERVFLTATEEIDPDNDIHSVRGCESFPCTEKQAVYYRVSRNALHDVYAFRTRGYFFYPEEVASVVAPGVNDCQVTSYGIRVRALMRGWGIYPHLLNAVCVPYNENPGRASAPAKPSVG